MGLIYFRTDKRRIDDRSIDGKKVRSPKRVTAAVVRKKIGDEITITLMRHGEKIEISAILEAKSKILE